MAIASGGGLGFAICQQELSARCGDEEKEGQLELADILTNYDLQRVMGAASLSSPKFYTTPLLPTLTQSHTGKEILENLVLAQKVDHRTSPHNI